MLDDWLCMNRIFQPSYLFSACMQRNMVMAVVVVADTLPLSVYCPVYCTTWTFAQCASFLDAMPDPERVSKSWPFIPCCHRMGSANSSSWSNVQSARPSHVYW